MPQLYSLYHVKLPTSPASQVYTLCVMGDIAPLSFLEDAYPNQLPTDIHQLAQQPSTAFYSILCQTLDIPPSSLLVLSADLRQHLVPANQGGFKTIWLTSRDLNPLPAIPVQVGEILHADELPALFSKELNPRLEDCDALLQAFSLPTNIIRHMQAVAQFAYSLAQRLQRAGVPLDPILVHRAAYLHDLDKLQSLQEGIQHGQSSAKTITAWGHPRIAQIVAAHVLERILDHPASLTSWEAKIVYYADKCFGGDQRISVQERCHRLIQRYPDSAAQIQQALPLILNLEQQLIHLIGHL